MPEFQHIALGVAVTGAVVLLVWLVIRQTKHDKENPTQAPRCVVCSQPATEPVPIAAQSRRNPLIGAIVDGDAGSQLRPRHSLVAWDKTEARLCTQHRRVGEHLVEQFELAQSSETTELQAKQSHEAAQFEATFFEAIRRFGQTPPTIPDASPT